MKNLKNQLPAKAAELFGNSKKTTLTTDVGVFTIKYYYSSCEKTIYYMVFRGKGHGVQIAGDSNFEEILNFVNNETEYKHITENETGKRGGALFYKGTENPVFSSHPFNEKGFKIN